MVNAVVKQFTSIDVLVNTIVPFYYQDVLEVTPEECLESVNMNLQVSFYTTYFAREKFVHPEDISSILLFQALKISRLGVCLQDNAQQKQEL